MPVKRFLITIAIFSLFVFNTAAAWAKEPDTPELTLKQAVEMALKNSTTVKNGQYSIEQAYETRKLSSQKLQSVPVGPSESSVTRFFYSLQQADLNWQVARKSYTVLEDSVEYATHQAYTGILQAQEKVNTCEKALRSSERQRLVAVASYKVGIINQLSMEQTEASLASAKDSYEEAIKALDDAYQKFNYVVGLWPEDRPKLTEVPSFEKLSVIDLNNYIERKLEENPSLWEKEKNVEIAKTALDTFDPTDPSEPYKSKEINVDKKILEAADAKEQARKALRTLYYTIGQLEEQYPVNVQNVKVAEESLRIAKLKYEIGMATSTDVAVEETALAKAKQQLLNMICQHDVLKLAFSKPWAYGL
ncbi:MAG: Outer membrane efflux protein [Pelotomaculum sp. PtaB.Bin104]|nr:MAG: Outer membrane efflux protein [Pelotomaculum sp. PtaB.Bin104]